MYHVSAQGVDEGMINVHYYYTVVSEMETRPSDKAGHSCGSLSSFFVHVTELQSKSYTIMIVILCSG